MSYKVQTVMNIGLCSWCSISDVHQLLRFHHLQFRVTTCHEKNCRRTLVTLRATHQVPHLSWESPVYHLAWCQEALEYPDRPCPRAWLDQCPTTCLLLPHLLLAWCQLSHRWCDRRQLVCCAWLILYHVTCILHARVSFV